MSSGDDGICLLQGSASSYEFIDCIGDFHGDPGSAWDVCGVSGATQDKTLIRKPFADTTQATEQRICAANPSEAIWQYTSSVANCQWDIYDLNTFTDIGQHVYQGARARFVGSLGCVFPHETSAFEL